MPGIAFIPVSVVIPCYRCSATISRAVGSVIGQSAKPAEIILVDDASGDGTLPALRELARVHPGWIRVVALGGNCGAASARNAGWDAAGQPYVAFLDADDEWHPEKLHIQYEYMSHNQEVVVSGHHCFRPGGENGRPGPVVQPAITNIGPFSLLFRNRFSTPTVMLKRDIPFRFSPGRRYSEDWDLWLRIAFSGLPVTRMECRLAYLHKAPYGEGGLSARLWEMERGELDNLAGLRKVGSIGWVLYGVAAGFSVTKYFKRVVLAWIRR